ncbi:4-hydroxy-3-methylbut-2-en-1-yl diphosphate synthase (flavodoxin) [Chlamydia muridarum str. Nigg]|uniref:4-hydroxy-3-methylbut-2-en-1-yl diphosphate synthase (flavodoxin) n=2 Tax=Chlamydia muridarum TaxID=83560 RepID=ISPG_CHLMU|nr:4-hydroxy-3-methylbut-2-en-1-yl diphosphate synthase [Chlamydia muridarum]Q9PKY3.1 RecName: Full=4-hydroxy-3-methylbut-2-en-1-yl diphosphate synthase (flavodoxin); AltName: Full=1-hydroxy-2-methyl-2-(E)-butenyl 4-diphosphate synthase [Chlamydia muridarum str. Nigg]UFW32871.1 4-hydroxy-3-methylbut-2-en-1-yl diphosphate synthase [Chlamydia trachomatis]AAF39191.1 gcpE protein [Chlamydia muridarum str. Nigg]AHH22717.1 4-hydroxy-3-methylbut-2-en-1-yl diphosphate synthase [Chlamydia muridarum str.
MAESYLQNGFRRKTLSVKVGNLFVGSEHSIKIQSMTTTATTDVEGTVRQIYALQECGCEIVRVTVQGLKEVGACEQIKDRLVQQNVTIPLVADIHFFPQAAIHVADFVDKVRINPGNYVDKRNMFSGKIYSDEQYTRSLERLFEKFSPLVAKCKRLGRAMRIGVNHGSLSERIMQRYGDTIEGMVFSALEYAEVCVNMDYHNIVFSMKSSNPRTMVAAYRALARELDQRKWLYPLHLGVTEAGSGMDGMIKSSVGIGTLLSEGLGDTIRCSLTGSPTLEIPVCLDLLKETAKYSKSTKKYNPFEIYHSKQLTTQTTPKHFPVENVYGFLVGLTKDHLLTIEPNTLLQCLGVDITTGKKDLTSPDGVVIPKSMRSSAIVSEIEKHLRIFYKEDAPILNEMNEELWLSDKTLATPFVYFEVESIYQARRFFALRQNYSQPVCLSFSLKANLSKNSAAIDLSIRLGALLLDGLGSCVLFNFSDLKLARTLGFSILQSANIRSTTVEYISCPGCGRTLFDLPEVSQRIKERTKHLPGGLKIAVMGCIVNGPGEMADADFGYVGSKPGMIDLYVKHKCVKSYVPMENAEEELIQLLKEHGVWKEPE